MSPDKSFTSRWSIIQKALLMLPILMCLPAVTAKTEKKVKGYAMLGRGSCQDSRGKFFSYIQRTALFPDPEACGGECGRWMGAEFYRGFEYSVAKRCTCLFDNDAVPAVPNSEEEPMYVSKMDDGFGDVSGISSTPGGWCYAKGAGSVIGTKTFYVVSMVASTAFYMLS